MILRLILLFLLLTANNLAAKDKMILSTLSNNVAFENIGDVAMVVRISRDNPGKQEDTRP